MPWTQVFDDNFTRSNGAVGNGWLDAASAWSITSNQLTTAGNSIAGDFLRRPVGESLTDQRADLKVVLTSSNSPIVILRADSSVASGYIFWLGSSGGTVLAYAKITNGSLSNIDVSTSVPGTSDGTQYILSATAVGTTIACTVAAAASPGTIIASVSKTDSSFASGVQAITSTFTGCEATEFTTFAPASSAMTVAGPNSATTIPANHSGNITLSLTGTSTSWGGGTTFTVSGVSGIAKVSQNISSTTAATVVISLPAVLPASAGNTGTLSVSDGSVSGTVNVGAVGLAVSPTSGNQSSAVSVTFTGTSTLWLGDAPTFTISGSGTSITGISDVTNTSATATIHTGSSGGSVTCTDPSTGATCTFTISSTIVLSPTSMVKGSGYQILTITGNGTSYTPGTPGSPTVTVGAGTILSQTVNSTTSISVDYAPPTSGSAVTVSDTSTSANLTLTNPAVLYNAVFLGNSLFVNGSPTIAAATAALLGPTWEFTNSGHSAQTTANIITNYASWGAAFYDGSKSANICVIFEITNDLYFNASAATAYNNIVTLAGMAVATGFKVVVLTALPRGEFGTSTIPGNLGQQQQLHESRRNTVNNSIRANWRSFCHGIVDLGDNPLFSPPGNAANSTYYLDGVHLNQAGDTVAASEIYPEILEALSSAAIIGGGGGGTTFVGSPGFNGGWGD